MNILITIDKGYLDVRCVMLKSLLLCHPDTEFTVYVLNSSLNDEDFTTMKQSLPSKRMTIVDVKAGKDLLADAPVTERYPKEMYYRIFAAAFLPDNVDRVLYLDPALVVIKPLYNLYSIDLDGFYFAAASHVGKFQTKNKYILHYLIIRIKVCLQLCDNNCPARLCSFFSRVCSCQNSG